MSQYDRLISQVDAFIRKYYKNRMLKGCLIFLIILLFSFLTVVTLEYIGRFGSWVRGFLLFAFLGVNFFILFKYFITPILNLFAFGERIDRKQAATIIGRFFPDVNDKLLNTLELSEMKKSIDNKSVNIELLEASIAANSEKLSIFSFSSAIELKENARYLKYLLPIFLISVVLAIWIPDFFSSSSQRIIQYNKTFTPPAPFTFELLNKELKIEEGERLEIKLKLIPKEGEGVPDKVYILGSEGRYLMSKSSNNEWTFVFDKVNTPIAFQFESQGWYSAMYEVEIVGRASLAGLKASLSFPRYLGRTDEVIENVGDLIVPEGTEVQWSGRTKNISGLDIALDENKAFFPSGGFKWSHVFSDDAIIEFSLNHISLDKSDVLTYNITVIKDKYPEISVQQTNDSLNRSKFFLEGIAKDDHGIKQVVFVYEITKKDGNSIRKEQAVPGVFGRSASFSINFDVNRLNLDLEDRLNYYFVVYDNDGVNGSKSSRSSLFTFTAPSKSDLNAQREELKENKKEAIKETITESEQLRNRLDKLKLDLLNTPNPSWKELQQLQELQKQKESLRNKLDKLQQDLMQNKMEQQRFDLMDEELLKQQELIEELLEQLMDDELSELLDKLQEMLENNQMKGFQELFEDMEMKADDQKRQLDRTLEMLKRMDVDERIDNLENALEDLAKDQLDLKKDLDNGDISMEEALKKQNDINEQFENLMDDLNELMEKNEDLVRPLELDGLEELAKEIQERLDGASDNLEKGKDKNAGDDQQKAGEKMEEMASAMSAQKQKSKEKQNKEDLAALRSLLENLLKLSFDQEMLLLAVRETSVYNPEFVQYGRNQRALIESFRPVEDSLRAIADRIPEVSSFINKELININKNILNMADDIDERRKREFLVRQQFVMTGLNNLALFLNESLENLQQDMQGSGSGGGSCDNPGGKGQGEEGDEMQSLKEMLKKQLEDMQKGQQEGGNKPGDKPGKPIPIPLGSQQAAQMAAQQQAIRKELERLKQELNKDGKGKGNELNDLLKELDKQHERLVNKQWDTELIERQKEILTRLLESEKALEERGWDEERESISGKDDLNRNQIEFLEYKELKEKQIELLKSLDPLYKKYYRDRVNDYFNVLF